MTGCTGVQSALAPSGYHAERIASLFWWMTGVGLVIWVFVIALALSYGLRPTGQRNRRRDRWLILGGGVAFPTVVLTILLIYGLAMIPETVARAPEGSLQVSVTGEQWWWRVTYRRPGGQTVVLANEIRLPVGEPTQFRLDSDNVIHSFWIPPLGGKMDMIPGRVTWLTLRPHGDRHLPGRVRRVLRHVARLDELLRRGDGAGRVRRVARSPVSASDTSRRTGSHAWIGTVPRQRLLRLSYRPWHAGERCHRA